MSRSLVETSVIWSDFILLTIWGLNILGTLITDETGNSKRRLACCDACDTPPCASLHGATNHASWQIPGSRGMVLVSSVSVGSLITIRSPFPDSSTSMLWYSHQHTLVFRISFFVAVIWCLVCRLLLPPLHFDGNQLNALPFLRHVFGSIDSSAPFQQRFPVSVVWSYVSSVTPSSLPSPSSSAGECTSISQSLRA